MECERTVRANIANKKQRKRKRSAKGKGLSVAIPPEPAVAQETRVFRKNRFLSSSEVIALVQAFKCLRLQPYTNSAVDWDDKGNAVHVTRYLQTDGIFKRQFPALRERIIQLARLADKTEEWGLLTGRIAVRCAEYHEMGIGGCLPELDHYDKGSLVTIDIMLKEPEEGATFQTVEAGGRLQPHVFQEGDALVFVGHKYHRVEPLKKGTRRVLVVELWSGEERECGHRCEKPSGVCSFRDGSDSGAE